MKNYLLEQYNSQYRHDLITKLNLSHSYKLPKLEKIVVSMGVKDSNVQKNTLLIPFFILLLITGQKPIPTKAKKSIALFKLRKGMYSGLKVTLRNEAMYEFLMKLVMIILPKNKDFTKFKLSKTARTNMFSIGIKNVLLFPEIEKQVDNNKIINSYGCNVTIVTSDSNIITSQLLLSLFGIPFTK